VARRQFRQPHQRFGATLAIQFQARAWELVTGASEMEVIAADLTITANCDLVIADGYGRVTNATNVGVGSYAYVVGKAKYAPTAVNQRIRASIMPRTVKM